MKTSSARGARTFRDSLGEPEFHRDAPGWAAVARAATEPGDGGGAGT